MSGPYREAFVELAQDAFDAAKRLGEDFKEAIVEAAKQHEVPKPEPELTRAARISIYHPEVWMALVKDVEDRFDWKLVDYARDSRDAVTVIRVRMSCKHYGFFTIDEHDLMRQFTPTNMVDFILDQLEKPPVAPFCSCGEPQGLGPAGRR